MSPSIARALCLAACALPALAPLAPAQDDEEEPPYDIEQDELECEEPPLELKRPNDSWLFIDLEALEARVRGSGGDASAFESLKARLWYGGARSNIYVNVYPAGGGQQDLEQLGRTSLENTQRSLREAEVLEQGGGRVGRRRAFLYEIEGQPARAYDGSRVRLVRAVVYRPEDEQIFVITLECALLDRYDDVRDDFMKFLRKAKL